MHDNDALTRHFAMNVIPWASNWGYLSQPPCAAITISDKQGKE
jgi:hypothetical protein